MSAAPLVRSKKQLRGLSSARLEAEANKLLYGSATVPKHLDGEQYQMPKYKSTHGPCVDCKRPRYNGSAARCKACYLKNSKKRRRANGADAINASVYLEMAEVGHEGIGETYERIRVVQAHDAAEQDIEWAAPARKVINRELAQKQTVMARELFDAGKSYDEISLKLSRPKKWVWVAVMRTGGTGFVRLTKEQKVEIVARIKKGQTILSIAAEMRIKRGRIATISAKLNKGTMRI